ncbi:MAG: hypothetical protein JW863_11980 [Chitinispirillaceae bacterium]|nr:hypothetical protein [Chitinispirillaceae bacterium]
MFSHNSHLSVILLVPVIMVFSCKRESARKNAARNDTAATAAANGASVAPVDYQEVYNRVTAAIERLTTDSDTVAKSTIVTAAWDSVSGGFYCPGKSFANPRLPEAARKEAASKAARLTARRWALLFSLWRRGDFRNGNTSVQGQVTWDDVVMEHHSGDTVTALVLVPLGSIIVE